MDLLLPSVFLRSIFTCGKDFNFCDRFQYLRINTRSLFFPYVLVYPSYRVDLALAASFGFAAGSDVGELSADGPDDVVGLDVVGAHLENLLSSEPADYFFGNYNVRSYQQRFLLLRSK